MLYNLAEFAAAYFERGAIKPTILQFGGKGGQAAAGERKRLEAWWSRVMRGVKNAFTSKVVAGEVTATVLGEGLGELSDSSLTKEQREDVLAALGIPVSVLLSSEVSGGLGSDSIATSDERKFYEQKVIPAAQFISSSFNEQVLIPMGYRWIDRPETLDVFQADENQRAQAFKLYIDAGMRLSVVAEMLGLELPTGVDYDGLDQMKEEDKEAAAERMPDFGGGQNPQSNPQNPQSEKMQADLGRWERKALSKGADCEFESEHIPPDVMTWVKAALAIATTDEEVKAAFAAGFLEAAGAGGGR